MSLDPHTITDPFRATLTLQPPAVLATRLRRQALCKEATRGDRDACQGEGQSLFQ